MTIQTIEDLFVHEMSDLYSAEKQLTKALPKLAKAANNQALIEAFEEHLSETENQVARLEKIAELGGFKIKRKKCVAMEGLVAEGSSLIEEMEEGAIRDMALISAAQKVEHYEMSAYLSLMKLAKDMGDKKIFKLLDQTLAEEEGADEKLAQICDQELEDAEDQQVSRAA